MDFSWFLLLVSAAVFVSIVLLAVICLDCRNKGPLRSIQQTASEEYTSPEFRVIHAAPLSMPTSRSLASGSISVAQPTLPPNPVIITTPPPDPHLRPPFSTKPEHRPYTPTETEPEKDVDDHDNYIEVLPDNPEESKGVPADIESRTSTPSSDHNYVNLDEEDDDDDEPYENVTPKGILHCAPDAMLQLSGTFPRRATYQRSTPGSSAQSSEDEYEESNYVNQPMGLVNH
ncbi:pollen-specific leucine-rich repeat extensin-like protein 2 isoform X6 [Simochromis diagramma]|uniref:pollen-specific leucine-rich repeat extensin-like protein 2 isoform X6 n=1 Tax=Simochromis diagramma TaxID=43689 RepID=UPI001A7E3588|nr:pollen-specific leucine-rich repeat extensin-like protein 2 isoform X6 [Simochromis diagramma]